MLDMLNDFEFVLAVLCVGGLLAYGYSVGQRRVRRFHVRRRVAHVCAVPPTVATPHLAPFTATRGKIGGGSLSVVAFPSAAAAPGTPADQEESGYLGTRLVQ